MYIRFDEENDKLARFSFLLPFFVSIEGGGKGLGGKEEGRKEEEEEEEKVTEESWRLLNRLETSEEKNYADNFGYKYHFTRLENREKLSVRSHFPKKQKLLPHRKHRQTHTHQP